MRSCNNPPSLTNLNDHSGPAQQINEESDNQNRSEDAAADIHVGIACAFHAHRILGHCVPFVSPHKPLSVRYVTEANPVPRGDPLLPPARLAPRLVVVQQRGRSSQGQLGPSRKSDGFLTIPWWAACVCTLSTLGGQTDGFAIRWHWGGVLCSPDR
jgi:hypothetical protein